MQCLLIVRLILLTEELVSILVVDEHGLTPMLQCLLFRRLLGLQVSGIDIVAVLLEEKLHCLNKTQALMLFHETDDIASFSAAKTFVHIQVGVEHQGGRLF